MTELLTEGGFENGGAAWSLFPAVTVVAGGHSGASALQLGPGQPALAFQAITATAPISILVSCWVKRTAGTDATLALTFIDSGASEFPSVTIAPDGTVTKYSSGLTVESTYVVPDIDDWFRVFHKTTVNAWIGDLFFAVIRSADGQPNPNTWLIDDCSVAQGDSVITDELRTALETDLATISIGNGYQTDVDAVYTEPKRLDEATKPCVFLRSATGSDSIEGLTACRRTGEQSFDVGLFVRGDDPAKEVDDLIDDIRNAVQVSTSAIMGATNVVSVECSWNQPQGDAQTSFGRADALITVTVAYTYSGGSA